MLITDNIVASAADCRPLYLPAMHYDFTNDLIVTSPSDQADQTVLIGKCFQHSSN